MFLVSLVSELLHKGRPQNYRARDWGTVRLFQTPGVPRNSDWGLWPGFKLYHFSRALLRLLLSIEGHLVRGLSNSYSTTKRSGVLQRIMGFLTNWWRKLKLSLGDSGWVVGDSKFCNFERPWSNLSPFPPSIFLTSDSMRLWARSGLNFPIWLKQR